MVARLKVFTMRQNLQTSWTVTQRKLSISKAKASIKQNIVSTMRKK